MTKFPPVSTSPGRHRRRRRSPQFPAQPADLCPDPGVGSAGATVAPSGAVGDGRQPRPGRTELAYVDQCQILTLSGEWDLSCRDELSEAAGALVQACRRDHVGVAVVDAAAVAFIDACCVGVLVDLHRNLHSVGIDARVKDASAALRRVSELCGLDAVFGLDHAAPADGATTDSPAQGGVSTRHALRSPQVIERPPIDQPVPSRDGPRTRWGRPVLLPRAGGWG